jgi:hypothetical protein
VDDVLALATQYRLRAHAKARSHWLAAKDADRLHTFLGVPVVALSAIVGSAVFATISARPDPPWQIATGMLSVAAGVLAAIQTFFRPAERADHHRRAAAGYAALHRSFKLFDLEHRSDRQGRDTALDELRRRLTQFDELEKQSPDLPDRLYDQAVREQRGDAEV